ncbi:sugar transporter [Hymenobacter sp. RP-2-7]|uniref:Sugar transporter n=1 Tax=Hymenobacter polaris TaxID=2682546 RepID=A0A7Y0FKF6_9BACT|nr:sugar transporter [Hymenobacter polaris]
MKGKFLQFVFLLLAGSCVPNRNIVYFSDLKETASYTEEIKNKVTPRIQPDDLLSITVSSLNPESNILFNNGVLQSAGSGGITGTTGRVSDGYLVDKDGAINFPVLGSVILGGLTKEEATEKMVSEIKKTVKNPIVNIRFLNFRITVVGEVNRPSTLTIPSESINIIEALGLAGDLTVYGKRENILIIRESGGKRTAARLDLTSKNILNSQYFYLQQNDVVYVEPVKAKSIQTGNAVVYLPIITTVISLISLLSVIIIRR